MDSSLSSDFSSLSVSEAEQNSNSQLNQDTAADSSPAHDSDSASASVPSSSSDPVDSITLLDDSHSSSSSSDFVPSLGPKGSFQSRLLQFHHDLNRSPIPLRSVQSFVHEYGIPDSENGDGFHLRSIVWKLLLGYLPLNHNEWEQSLKANRANYEEFVQQLTINPYAKLFGKDGLPPSTSSAVTGGVQFERVNQFEDPLSTSKSSEWTQFYSDQEIRKEVQKDVMRTYSNFHFFNERVKPLVVDQEHIKQLDKQYREDAEKAEKMNCNTGYSTGYTLGGGSSQLRTHSLGSQGNLFDNLADRYMEKRPIYVSPPPKRAEDERHCDVLERILFLYAKLNPGVRYVQGMNEILAPIYYTFSHDRSQLFKDHAEADAFFCFTAIMAEIRDRFIKSLDSSPSGVLAVVAELNMLLKECDFEVWQALEHMGVDPRFYSFRWITLLLSQEFELPEVLRLWDSLFADSERFQFLLYVCVAMIVCVRHIILQGDFAETLRALQHAGENGSEFHIILRTAHNLKRERNEKKMTETKVREAEGVKEKQQNSTSSQSSQSQPQSQSQTQSQSNVAERESRRSLLAPASAAVGIDVQVSKIFNSVGSFFRDISSSLKS